jgi:hypothetical protein
LRHKTASIDAALTALVRAIQNNYPTTEGAEKELHRLLQT